MGKTPRGPYLAVVFVGTLAAQLVGDELAATTVGLADAVLQTYYPHERPSARPDPSMVEVGGRPACRLVVPMDVDDVNLDFTTETAVFAVVDLGTPSRGVLFASLPGVEHVPSADEVLAQVQFAPA